MDYPNTILNKGNMQNDCLIRLKNWKDNMDNYSLFQKYIGKNVDVYLHIEGKLGWCGMRKIDTDCMLYTGDSIYVVKREGDWFYGFKHVSFTTYKDGLTTVKKVLSPIVVNKKMPDVSS